MKTRSHFSKLITTFYTVCALTLSSGGVLHGAGSVQDAGGFGRHAVRPLLDTPDSDIRRPDVGAELAGFRSAASDILKAGNDGRLQLFNLTKLGTEDMRNPFDIRVLVHVDMLETTIEVGGIVEGENGQKNSALLYVKPTVTVTKEQIKARNEKKTPQPTPAVNKKTEKGRKFLCCAGESVDGFRVHEVRRDAVVLESLGKLIEISQNKVVTVCIPVTALK